MTAVPAPAKLDPVARVALLGEALDAVTRYTLEGEGIRLGFHDLALLETLRGRRDRLHVSPETAMIAIIAAETGAFIGGHHGADVWEQFDDDAEHVVDNLSLGWAAEDPDDPDYADDDEPDEEVA